MFTKDQLSLLLFLETCAVDHSGRVNTIHMNEDDMEQAAEWSAKGFIYFGRIYSKDLNENGTHWVELSDEAWNEVAKERKARAFRRFLKRDYLKTTEK